MCNGVFYTHNGQDIRVYFPNPNGMLPVRAKNGEVRLLPWGRRSKQPGKLPRGGWARLSTIHSGSWDRWFPVPVKIPVKSFMERDIEGHSHWYDLTRGKWLQGLVARDRDEQRVYVVVIEPEMADAAHERWPRILS